MFGVQPRPEWQMVRAGDMVRTPSELGCVLTVFVGTRMVQVIYRDRNAGLLVPLDDVQFWSSPAC